MPATNKSQVLYKLTGDRALLNRLKRMENAAQNKIAKPALKKMAQIIRNKQKAVSSDSAVKKSIGMQLGTKRGTERAKIGVNIGKSRKGKLSNKTGKLIKGSQANPIALLLVWGTKPRYTGATTRAKGRRGKLTSTGKPRHFTGLMKRHFYLKIATESILPTAIAEGRRIAWSGILHSL